MAMEVLRCLLLPIQGRILLLPYSAVAELVPLENAKDFGESKTWKLGRFSWRELDIPLVCIEMSEADKKFVPQSLQLVAVLNRFSDAEGTPDFIGVVLSGIPSMARFKTSDVHFTSEGDVPYVQMNVRARNMAASIPNMGWIMDQMKG